MSKEEKKKEIKLVFRKILLCKEWHNLIGEYVNEVAYVFNWKVFRRRGEDTDVEYYPIWKLWKLLK